MIASRVEWSRGRVADMLTDEATVIRITYGDDGAGGRPRIETTLGPYPFRLQTAAPRDVGAEMQSADRLRQQTRWIGFFAYDVVIEATDIIVHGGLRYEVIGDTTARTDRVTVGVFLRRSD